MCGCFFVRKINDYLWLEVVSSWPADPSECKLFVVHIHASDKLKAHAYSPSTFRLESKMQNRSSKVPSGLLIYVSKTTMKEFKVICCSRVRLSCPAGPFVKYVLLPEENVIPLLLKAA